MARKKIRTSVKKDGKRSRHRPSPVREDLARVSLDVDTGDGGAFIDFWIKTHRLGLAIDRAIEIATSPDLECKTAFADNADWCDKDNIPDDAIEMVPGCVYRVGTIHAYPIEEFNEGFRFPAGVVPSFHQRDGFDTDDIHEAYQRRQYDDTYSVTAVVDGRQVESFFFELIEGLPSADAIEIRVCGDYDDHGTDHVWLTPNFPRRDDLVAYLDERRNQLLRNGFVEVAVYARNERSTLRLTEHKTIDLLADDESWANEFECMIRNSGLHPAKALQSLEREYVHYHYRPRKSSSRDELESMLKRDGLRKVTPSE